MKESAPRHALCRAVNRAPTTVRSLAFHLALLLLPIFVGAKEIDVRQAGAVGDGKTDDSAALQRALDGGKRTVVIPAGTYIISKALLMDSDTTIQADRRAVIRLADKAGNSVEIFLLRNRDQVTGNRNIIVKGGIWDGNEANNPPGADVPPSYTGIALSFTNVDHLTLAGLIVRDPARYAIRCWGIKHFLFEDIGFDYATSRGIDGIHLNGYCEDGVIRDIRALTPFATNDDMIALNADDADGSAPWAINYGTVLGPIRNIHIEHLRAENAYSFVRLLSHEHPIENITIVDVVGGVRSAAVNMHYWRFTRGGGEIRNVLLKDFNVHKNSTPKDKFHNSYPLLNIALATHNLRIENFRRDPRPQPDAPTILVQNGLTNRLRLEGAENSTRVDRVIAEDFTLKEGGFSLFSLDAKTSAMPPASLLRPMPLPDTPAYHVTDQPGLPRVLIIGDAIAADYFPIVQKELKGYANVHHTQELGGSTWLAQKRVNHWVGDSHWRNGKSEWDLILFNFGLDDLRYINDDGEPVTDPSKGRPATNLRAYEDNLRTLIGSLGFTRTKLIFANTTPVPVGAETRIPGDEIKYNEVAGRVMKENKIPVCDLAAVARARPELQIPKDVRFSAEGSQALGKAVAECIEAALAK